MKKLLISAPFGNYLESDYADSTIGTYTLENRAGWLRWKLFWKLAWTLRWKTSLSGWINKLGLPNPGIEYLLARPHLASGKILSIHGFNLREWRRLLDSTKELKLLAVELNISCPNIGHIDIQHKLFESALGTNKSVIVKLPPTNYWHTFKEAHTVGIRNFHCCNTLYTPSGGLSGKVLKPICLDVISRIKDYDAECKLIGGGGISTTQDISDYQRVGAEHFSIGSAFFHPSLWFYKYRNQWLRDLDS